MRLSVSPTPSNTPSNTPSVTPSNSSCPVTPSFTPTNTPTISPSGTQPCFDSGTGFSPAAAASQLEIINNSLFVGHGGATSYSGQSIQRFVKLDLFGNIDNSLLLTNGFSATSIFDSIKQQSTGKLIISGRSLRPINKTFAFGFGTPLCRLDVDGSFDNTFPTTSFPITGTTEIWDVYLESDDSLLCVGTFTSYSGYSSNRIIKLTSGGTIDTTVNFGTGFDATVFEIKKQVDGKYVAIGNFDSYSGISAPGVIRLNADFSVDVTFNATLTPNIDKRTGWIQTDGKILVGGSSGTGFNNLIRLNTDGSVDTTFSGITSPIGFISDIQLDEYGNIYVWNSEYLILTKFNSDGTTNVLFDGTGFNGGEVRNFRYYNSRLYCVGNFLSKNGIEANGIIVLDSTYGTIIDCTITPTPTNTATYTPTPTSTPTNTTSVTPKQDVYISLCMSGTADENGNLLVYAYADTIPNSFGNNPVTVSVDVNLDNLIEGDTTPPVGAIIPILSGTTSTAYQYGDFAPFEGITGVTILDLFPSSSSSQNYYYGGFQIGSSCITITPTPTNTPTNTPTPTVTPTSGSAEECQLIQFETTGSTMAQYQFTDCNNDTWTFYGQYGLNVSYCGLFSTAIILSGDGSVYLSEDNNPPCNSEENNSQPIMLGYDASDGTVACSNFSSSPVEYFINAGIISLTSGDTIYVQFATDTDWSAPAGFYSDGTYIYELDANGQIIMIYSCTCCYQYEVTNYYTTSKTVYYTDCDGTPQSISCSGNGNQTIINCAEEGSVYTNDTECNGSTTDCVTWVQASSPCGGCV